MRKWIIRKLGGIPLEDVPRPRILNLRQQCGLAVIELMSKKDVKFSKIMKISEMSADKLWWYLMGDRRGSPGKDMDLLEQIAPALDSHWVGPRFAFEDDECTAETSTYT